MGEESTPFARVGLYAWGGPGTVRLIRTKYHRPAIDTDSFLQLYGEAYLRRAKQLFGVTDMWVTYSWGFSDRTEAEDYAFLRQQLPLFRKHGIATHAYVQGLNLVTDEFSGTDVFCRDARGRLLPYSKGRSFICPNNPAAVAIVEERVRRAAAEDVDGVFVDNIVFGAPPALVRHDAISFFGCACRHCVAAFRKRFGYPLDGSRRLTAAAVSDYLQFRTETILRFLRTVAKPARQRHKQFGINLYDPWFHTPELYFGYCFADIAPLLDYYLLENHTLQYGSVVDTSHLVSFFDAADKPIFIVSYRNGIGYDSTFSQADINAIWSDAAARGYLPCLKVTEYVTDGVWHTLPLGQLKQPAIRLPSGSSPVLPTPLKRTMYWERPLLDILSKYQGAFLRRMFHSESTMELLGKTGLVTRALKTPKRYPPGAWEETHD